MSCSKLDTVSQIDAALRFIPADDRQTWITVGMAVKAELGDNGFAVWDYWSQTGSTYNERDARAVWRSFKNGGTRIGTLFHLAKQHGYSPDKQAPVRPIPQKKAPPPPKRDTGAYAAEIWLRADCSDDAVASHPYAKNKHITHAGGAGRTVVSGRVVGQDADCIVVPIRDISTDKVMAVQCINPEGKKQTFGPVSGYGLVLGNTLDKSLYWCVAEGWASAYSMVFHHMHGDGVAACSFGKSNQDALAQVMAEVYKPDVIHILREQSRD